MRFAGIAWTDRGFDVALLAADGSPAAPVEHFPAGSGRRAAGAPDRASTGRRIRWSAWWRAPTAWWTAG